jgi:hypothetical protein
MQKRVVVPPSDFFVGKSNSFIDFVSQAESSHGLNHQGMLVEVDGANDQGQKTLFFGFSGPSLLDIGLPRTEDFKYQLKCGL